MALDPTLQRLLKRLYASGFGNLHLMSLEQIRAFLKHPKLKVTPASFEDYQTEKGLFIRCYTPPHTQTVYHPVIIFLSASAFIIDRKEASNEYCSLLAKNTNMKVINVIQRLPPAYRFPQYIYDTLSSIKWIYQHCDLLKIFPDKIALWGESSGGSIAASVTHLLRDEKLDFIKQQILFYPLLDLVTSHPSREAFQYGYMLDKTFINWLYDLMSCHQNDRENPLASPLLSTNFRDLPPTTIITAEYDPFRDEGHAYVQKLHAAGVAAKEQRYTDMIHGFMRFYGKIPTAQMALDFAAHQLRERFSW